MQLAHTYPHLQLKLQDLPERVIQAQHDVWPKECPAALKDGRIEFKAMDFFAESPIKGCDIYYVRLLTAIPRLTFISHSRPGTAEEHHVCDDSFQIDPTMTLFSHNWSDEECLKILRAVRNALKPTSRVLIRT